MASSKNSNQNLIDRTKKFITKKIVGGVTVLGLLTYFAPKIYDHYSNLREENIKNVQQRRENIKREIRRLWITQVDVGELHDSEGTGPKDSIVDSLLKIEESQIGVHSKDWYTHFKNKKTQDLKDAELEAIEWNLDNQGFIARKFHAKEYAIAALKIKGNDILKKEIYVASILPRYLIPPDLVTNLKNPEELSSFDSLALSTVGALAYTKDVTNIPNDYPVIKVSGLSKLSIASVSLNGDLERLVNSGEGYLIPKFGTIQLAHNCYESDVGLIKVNTKDDRCKSWVDWYTKVSTNMARVAATSGIDCKEDVIADGSAAQIDPCLLKGEFVNGLNCKRSIEAYIRKVKQQGEDKSHLQGLLNKCAEDINKLKNPEHKALFK